MRTHISFKSPLADISPSLLLPADQEIGKGWFFLKWKVTNLDPRERREIRMRQSGHAQDNFRRAVLTAVPTWLALKIKADLRAWEAHHAVFLAFGGKSRHLALVHDVAHACIHGFVKEQMEGWAPHERRMILIPVRKGIIWGSETISLSFKQQRLCHEWARELLLRQRLGASIPQGYARPGA